MRRYVILAVLAPILLSAWCRVADAGEDKRDKIQLQVFKIHADISGKTSLTDNIWAGLDEQPQRPAANQGRFTFFVLAELKINGVQFVATDKAWKWNGKDLPPSDRRLPRVVRRWAASPRKSRVPVL